MAVSVCVAARMFATCLLIPSICSSSNNQNSRVYTCACSTMASYYGLVRKGDVLASILTLERSRDLYCLEHSPYLAALFTCSELIEYSLLHKVKTDQHLLWVKGICKQQKQQQQNTYPHRKTKLKQGLFSQSSEQSDYAQKHEMEENTSEEC